MEEKTKQLGPGDEGEVEVEVEVEPEAPVDYGDLEGSWIGDVYGDWVE